MSRGGVPGPQRSRGTSPEGLLHLHGHRQPAFLGAQCLSCALGAPTRAARRRLRARTPVCMRGRPLLVQARRGPHTSSCTCRTLPCGVCEKTRSPGLRRTILVLNPHVSNLFLIRRVFISCKSHFFPRCAIRTWFKIRVQCEDTPPLPFLCALCPCPFPSASHV